MSTTDNTRPLDFRIEIETTGAVRLPFRGVVYVNGQRVKSSGQCSTREKAQQAAEYWQRVITASPSTFGVRGGR